MGVGANKQGGEDGGRGLDCHVCASQHHQTCGLLLQNHAMSHVQLLRAIFHALADPGTFSQGIFMQWGDAGQGSLKAAAPSQQAMRKAFDVVFVDSSGWCNLAAHVTKSALKQVSRSSIPL